MNSFIIFLFTYTIIGFSFADNNTGNISGQVLNHITSEPLPGVNITLQGTRRGSISDNNGKFHISEIEEGKYYMAF